MAARIDKASAEALRLERLLRGYENRVRRAFRRFVSDVQSDAVLRVVGDMLARNDVAGAMRVVESHIARLGSVLPTIFAQAGMDYAEILERAFKGVEPGLALSFNPDFPRAARIAQQNRLDFIRNFTASQREAVRMAIAPGFRQGWSASRMAREFRSVVGLTDRQEAAVQNYRTLLEQNRAGALDRDLRDRRFDGTVRGALARDEPLSQDQIDRMTERYRDRYRSYRADVIARTEAGQAAAIAQDEALEQAIETTGLDRSRVKRTWNTSQDARVRDTHSAMNGQTRGRDEAFESPSGARLRYPRDPNAPPAETIQCRCALTVDIDPPE